MKQPKGFPTYGGKVKVAVSLSPELFERVKSYAERNNIRFSEAVDRFCKAGVDRVDALERSKALMAREFA